MPDCSIIIDHLSCPAQPFDGLGLFNCTYSLTHSIKNQTFISKYNNKTPMYFVNESFDKEKYKEQAENYYIILNQLKEIECHFCNLQAISLTFFDYPKKIVAVCNDHISIGSKKEFNSKPDEDLDIRSAVRSDIKKILKIVNNDIVTQNVYKTDLDPDSKIV
jgi:hypothetical protein